MSLKPSAKTFARSARPSPSVSSIELDALAKARVVGHLFGMVFLHVGHAIFDGLRRQIVVEPVHVAAVVLDTPPPPTRCVSATKIRPRSSKQNATGLANSGSAANSSTFSPFGTFIREIARSASRVAAGSGRSMASLFGSSPTALEPLTITTTPTQKRNSRMSDRPKRNLESDLSITERKTPGEPKSLQLKAETEDNKGNEERSSHRIPSFVFFVSFC